MLHFVQLSFCVNICYGQNWSIRTVCADHQIMIQDITRNPWIALAAIVLTVYSIKTQTAMQKMQFFTLKSAPHEEYFHIN